MIIRGLSYHNGIFYIGKEHVACAYHENGQLKSWLKPLNTNTFMTMIRQLITSMPLWFKLVTFVYLSLIFVPKLLAVIDPGHWMGFPYFMLIYYLFGTHFIFPKQLKKYHGAEHKVFSYKGVISRPRLYSIKKALITNRHCSTNLVVIYFLSVILGTLVLMLARIEFQLAITIVSYGSVLLVPVVQRLMKVKQFHLLEKGVLAISYWLQVYVTTTEPDRKHMIASIESYRKLAAKEFPERLVVHKNVVKKETEKMAIVDVTVVPVGTNTPSVSKYVAGIQEVLKSYEGKVKFQLTPMSTIIEGELPVLFEVIQAIHEVPFKHGLDRVTTNIRIDDRRDKVSTMEGKVKAVESHLVKKDS